MSSPLISTKFNIPSVSARHVRRLHLSKMLNEGMQQPASLILVCGPAGYGKTMVVSDWLQTGTGDRSLLPAWLTLEVNDDEPTRFLTYLVAALQHIDSRIGKGVLKMLHTHRPSPVQALASFLINDLSKVRENFLLVLDDFHVISAESIRELVAFLVDHQPPRMHLVLLTRADPPLPLARLRARGRLVELRQRDLRFGSEEVDEFINRVMDLAMTPEQLTLLERRTEGWIAGLQMAALSLRNLPDKSSFLDAFSGEHEFIADYLTDEVLSRLPENERTFLLQTSILKRLSASLCEALTGRTGVQAVLDELTEANLFLVPLDEQRQWFRYHTLFADLLRKRLQEEAAGEILELHRRASRWHRDNNLDEEAVEHALVGEDYDSAATLIEQVAEKYLTHGDSATLLRWLEALPEATLLKRPALGALKGFALILCNRSPLEISTLLREMEAAGSLMSSRAK